jgi:hypothetical protein
MKKIFMLFGALRIIPNMATAQGRLPLQDEIRVYSGLLLLQRQSSSLTNVSLWERSVLNFQPLQNTPRRVSTTLPKEAPQQPLTCSPTTTKAHRSLLKLGTSPVQD